MHVLRFPCMQMYLFSHDLKLCGFQLSLCILYQEKIIMQHTDRHAHTREKREKERMCIMQSFVVQCNVTLDAGEIWRDKKCERNFCNLIYLNQMLQTFHVNTSEFRDRIIFFLLDFLCILKLIKLGSKLLLLWKTRSAVLEL